MKCFAEFEDGCAVLKEKNCNGCSFYKTVEKFEKDRRKSNERLERKFKIKKLKQRI